MAKSQASGKRLKNSVYEAELFRLQTEFVDLQEWTRETGARIVVIFEGRDAAGKGGTIKRITQYLSPRVVQIAALPAPSDRERGQWYFQRYISHLPAAGGSSCSTGLGTTAPASRRSWVSVRRPSTPASCGRPRSSSRC